ncbi:MAG TPA: Rieske 2Fe-2S domain-containing protein [Blastocatellia bacterium]|nr:Rieske 2Fe-2S domain-containing protein [Blastocatellia bacterium]
MATLTRDTCRHRGVSAADEGESVQAFVHPSLVTQSWYVAARSNEVRAGRVKSFDLLRRRIAVFRDAAGQVHAMDAHCPHLGADLANGTVTAEGVRCAFHGWVVGANGVCRMAGRPSDSLRHTRVYPALERWGLIWIFNGPQPLFDLPGPPAGKKLKAWRLPPQHINCHPHLVIANGLDISHYESLHRMRFTAPPRLEITSEHSITLNLRFRPESRWQQLLSGTRRREVAAAFTTIGSSLAWASVTEPLRFDMLFAGRPARGGGCETRTILFYRARRDLVRALTLMYALLYDDRHILDGVQFTPHFTASDAPLKAFADLVNSLGTR